MSLIKSIMHQLGLSVTPANNFTFDAAADNGTMKLARGNAGATTQDLITVNAAGVVSNRGSGGAEDAAAGFIGEYLENIRLTASAVSLTTDVAANIASITLTPGDWDVDGFIGFNTAATTSVTRMIGQINNSVAYTAGDPLAAHTHTTTVINTASIGSPIMPVPTRRYKVTVNTTVYLIGLANFTISTMTAFGTIQARRMR